MTMQRSAPILIVSREVEPKGAREFGLWVNRLLLAASNAPGYVSAAVHRPSASNEDQWLIVYRFTDRGSLDSWLASEVRSDLLVDAADLLAREATVQIVASQPSGASVRVVSSYRLCPGTEGDHAVAQVLLERSLRSFPGFLARDVLDPVEGVQPDTVLMLTFETEERVHAWIESPQRSAFLEAIGPLIDGDLTTNVVGSFGGWFPASVGNAVKRWKQVVVVLLALVPLSLLMAGLEVWLWPGLPSVWSVLVSDVVTITVLTYLFMPPLTRALEGWLAT